MLGAVIIAIDVHYLPELLTVSYFTVFLESI